jgi:hypothetical protein
MTPQEIKARLGTKFMLGSQGDRLAQEIADMLQEQLPTGEQMAEAFVAQSEPVDVEGMVTAAREEGSAVGMMTMAGWAAIHIGGAEPDEGFPEAPDDVKELLAGIKQEVLGSLIPGEPMVLDALVSQEDADQLSEQAKVEGYTAGFRDGAVAAKDAAIVAADQVKVAATGPSIKAGINKAIEAIEDISLESLEK